MSTENTRIKKAIKQAINENSSKYTAKKVWRLQFKPTIYENQELLYIEISVRQKPKPKK